MSDYKVLLTTSGTGSRLGEITDYTNKALVRVGKKPSISYIVELYPEDAEIVVTLGYFGDQVRDFLELAYPQRKFTFVNVDKYSGEGSSLVYSILQAESEIDRPFIYHACDTLLPGVVIPPPSRNWIGGFNSPDSRQYRSLRISGEVVQTINQKGELYFDSIHVGLVGIFDHAAFFEEARTLYNEDHSNYQLSDCDVLNILMSVRNIEFAHFKVSDWLDIGNIDDLKKARLVIEDKFELLDKMGESLFLFDDSVIKFFHDQDIVSKRVQRATVLGDVVPTVLGRKGSFYKYEYVEGDLLASVVTPQIFDEFLEWSQGSLWHPAGGRDLEFRNCCKKFYFEKSKQRVQAFLAKYNQDDTEIVINGELVPGAQDLVDRLDEDWLCEVEPYSFHGDLILDNILKTKDSFRLLDWRQEFGGLIEKGDIYYDLGKLNHNLTFNHDIVNRGLFKIDVGNQITCDILVSHNLLACRDRLFAFLGRKGLDEKKVRVMSALIWINMSPLHDYPLDVFLFYFGRYNLWRELEI